jgi:hypothetical protein
MAARGAVELSSSYNTSNFGAWFNFSYAVAQVNYLSSMQFSVDPEELAYINSHSIPIDQTQLFTISSGATYPWHNRLFSFDATGIADCLMVSRISKPRLLIRK